MTNFKNPLIQTIGPGSIQRGTGIQICLNEGPWPLSREYYSENILMTFKNILENYWANFNQTWHNAFFSKGESNLLKNEGLCLIQRE